MDAKGFFVIHLKQADPLCFVLEVAGFKPRLGDRLSGLRLFHGFHQLHQADTRLVFQLGHGRHLPVHYPIVIIRRILIRAIENGVE
jgi:hypothetical protein